MGSDLSNSVSTALTDKSEMPAIDLLKDFAVYRSAIAVSLTFAL